MMPGDGDLLVATGRLTFADTVSQLRDRELSGPAEAVAMALTGRRAALGDLDGPGRAVLAARLS